MTSIIVISLIAAGLGFLTIGAIGVLRFPDFFTRSHALGLADTLGIGLVLTGLAVYQGLTLTAVKTILILLFLYHLNPVISHLTLRAALRTGLMPWMETSR